jgi:hypothetical protein
VSEFFNSIKADLLDRRLRAVMLALCLGLVGALVYALSGGSTATPAPTAAAPVPSAPGIAAVPAPATAGNQAVAETTSGAAQQREGKSRNPFTALAGSKTTATPAASASSASQKAAKNSAQKTSQSSGASPSTGSSGSSSKGGKSKPAPHKPKPVYRVTILFGIVPEGTPAQDAQLTPYTNFKLGKKLPSPKTPLLSFHEVTAGGKRAVFDVLGEVFLNGSASCLPSASQCHSIALAKGQSEEIEYLPADGGHPIVYDLQVVSITTGKAAAARARVSLLHRLHVLSLLASPAPVVVNR